ncbi:MAG TPA: YceI family protein [Catalimonadaceae bacterium]|jgi:polyisoprenoid-binding protein YceI|nr:YceI family protein [Catalimonadaceae bacterium]
MKKSHILSFIFLCGFGFTQSVIAQKFWQTGTGTIDFFSKTPVEDIEAHSKVGGAIINTETGQLAFKVPIKSFRFPNNLMEEHFNENYMESEKYPEATFSGKMEPLIDFSKPGTYPVKAKGKFKVHGVEVEREFAGTITVNADKSAELKCDFDVPLEAHKIERPQLVLVKIADKIAVKTVFLLKPKE